jgi:hypothetical protein
MHMEIHGRDVATESYRVTHDVDGRTVLALVPERLAKDFTIIADRPSHQTAYVWIAAHKEKIEAAIESLARQGRSPKAPFDQITLIKEH